LDLVCARFGRAGVRSRSRLTTLAGSPTGSLEQLLEHAVKARLWALEPAVIHRLVRLYGSAYADVLKLIRESLTWREALGARGVVLKAEVVYAIRQEMAQTLGDVVFRRTGLGAEGFPGWQALEACADVMAGELAWDDARIAAELRQVQALFARHGVAVDEAAPQQPPAIRRLPAEAIEAVG